MLEITIHLMTQLSIFLVTGDGKMGGQRKILKRWFGTPKKIINYWAQHQPHLNIT